jgi:hypothetical protein
VKVRHRDFLPVAQPGHQVREGLLEFLGWDARSIIAERHNDDMTRAVHFDPFGQASLKKELPSLINASKGVDVVMLGQMPWPL